MNDRHTHELMNDDENWTQVDQLDPINIDHHVHVDLVMVYEMQQMPTEIVMDKHLILPGEPHDEMDALEFDHGMMALFLAF